MSRPLISLIEQKYISRRKAAIHRVDSELSRELRNVPVSIVAVAGDPARNMKVEGKVLSTSFDDLNQNVILTIQFEDPFTGEGRTETRRVSELKI